MGENRVSEERVCRDPLQSQLACALAPNPNDSKLGFLFAHLHIKDLAGPNFSSYSLNYQPTGAHIRHQGRVHKRLAMGIHSPNLHRKLDFNSWALPSIHRDIVR